MRSEIWRQLFIERGWLNEDLKIVPTDANVEIHFRDGRIAFLSSISSITEHFLVISTRNQTIHVLWEDIKDIVVEKG